MAKYIQRRTHDCVPGINGPGGAVIIAVILFHMMGLGSGS